MSETIEHKVSSCDSLRNIALRYGCSVQDIMKLNRLTSTDIWMKSALIVPIPNKKVESWDPEMEDNMKKTQQVTTLSSAAQINPAIAKELLEERNYECDMQDMLVEMKTIKRLARDCGVCDEEAKAYYLLGERNYDTAKRLFIEDRKWEQSGRGKAAAYKKLTSMSDVVPVLLGAPLSTDDDDLNNLLDERDGALRRNRQILYEGPPINLPPTKTTNHKFKVGTTDREIVGGGVEERTFVREKLDNERKKVW